MKDFGIILISFGHNYDKITPKFIKSVRKFSDIPILVHTNIPEECRTIEWEDIKNIEFILHDLKDSENRLIKTNLYQYTKFYKTLYVDVDSVILSEKFLNEFNDLDNFDMCIPKQNDNLTLTNMDSKLGVHSKIFKKKIIDKPKIFPNNFFILGGGVCYFKYNNQVKNFFEDFLADWKETEGRDMPSLFYTYFKNKNKLKIKLLTSDGYNGLDSKIIRSLHNSDAKESILDSDFVRRRFDPSKNLWSYMKQGSNTFIKIPKIALLYDVKGWAFYIICNNLKKHLSSFFDVDVVSCNNFIDNNYDVVITFSPLTIPKKIDKKKLIVGISSHKNYEHLKNYNYVITNDKKIYNILDNKNKFYTPNGVDTKFFKGSPKKIDNQKIKLGLISSLIRKEHKGFNRIDKIVEKLKDKGFSIENKKMLIDSNDTKNIKSQKEIKDYYDDIDIFIISSYSETGPNTLLEAMSMGVPVITNNVGLASDLVINKKTGFLIENYNDIDAYVNYVTDLVTNNKLYDEISKNAIQKVKEYDWGFIYKDYKNVLDIFLQNKNPGVSPEISILIPTYKNTNYIDECLNSIVESSKDQNIEIIIGIDGCTETLNYVKSKQYPEFIKFFYFKENVGPYIVKNTLTEIARSNNLLFFDSDDIMTKDTIDEIIQGLKTHNTVRLKYEFYANQKTSNKNNFGEGVFAINKNLFLSMNGFEPWKVAADTDFIGRLYKNKPRMYHTKNVGFYYRQHSKSLTKRPDTGMSSKLRAGYVTLIKNKKGNLNPSKLHTVDFEYVDVNTVIVDTKNQEYYNQRKSQLDKVLNTTPRKVVSNVIKKKDPVINDRTDFLYTNPKPLVREIKPNKPENRQELINLKNNTNKSIYKELFDTKPNRRTGINPITIGGKSKI